MVWMRVCLFDNNPHTPRCWETAKITRRIFRGKVYSLKVQANEANKRLYVTNGIVTHNSIMGFAGASADALRRMDPAEAGRDPAPDYDLALPQDCGRRSPGIVPDIVAAEGAIGARSPTLRPSLPSWTPRTPFCSRNTGTAGDHGVQSDPARIACKVEGREIGNGLLRLVDRWEQLTTVGAFLASSKTTGLARCEGDGEGPGVEGHRDQRSL
jgi:hypothetical protein